MTRSASSLDKLGQSVVTALESAAPERVRAIEEARRGFLQHEVGHRAQRSRAGRVRFRRLALAVAFAGTAAAAATFFVFPRGRTPLTFEVDGVQRSAKTWIAAAPERASVLSFSDGTRIRVEAAARARVVDIDAHGANLALESGSVHAEVAHRPDSAWKVVAGPFTVSDLGTVFDVHWDPNGELLGVTVVDGSVLVRESNTGIERTVRAPDTLRLSASGRSPENEPVSDAVRGAPASSAPSVEVAEPDASAAENRPSSAGDHEGMRPSTERSAETSEWRGLAKRGALREAFRSAEATGFSQACESATPAELLMLGDGARLSGKPERATFALLALRQKYPTDSRRAAAAFALGKVAFDQLGAYERAAEWFATCLREQPAGPLARAAAGRLLEALAKSKDAAGARHAARDYLGKYPEGPHADLARSLLY